MEKTKRYEIEGRILDIPVHWDERSQQYLEDYSSLIENPVDTPEGRPILLTMEDQEYINAVTKRLYPEIAKQHGTTASRVERAIRHAIEVAWDRGDVDTLNSYFGYTIHNLRGKPTNSEFVAMISDRMRLDKKQRQA